MFNECCLTLRYEKDKYFTPYFVLYKYSLLPKVG
jgi:hypothetical protein